VSKTPCGAIVGECRKITVCDIALCGTNRGSGSRSLNMGAFHGRRAHGALSVAAGDGCELLVTSGDVGAVAQASRAGYQSRFMHPL
jgi:hypothetical protein